MTETASEPAVQHHDDSGSSEEEVLRYLSSIQDENTNHIQRLDSEDNVEVMLNELIGVTENLKTPLMEYWEANKSRNVLYKLSQVIYSVPPTQTTVERAFSAFALVLTALRNRLSDENLQNILLLRLNKNILEQI